MHLVLEHASRADAPAIARIWTLGFVDDLNLLRYGRLTYEDKIDLFTRRILKYMEDATAPWLVVRDADANGRIAAYARWQYPIDEDAAKPVEERELTADEKVAKRKEQEENYLEEFGAKFNIPLQVEWVDFTEKLREDTLQGRKAFSLESLATDPDYRRRGAAKTLVQWPFDQADQMGALVYIDTFQGGEGEQLYRNLGLEEQRRDSISNLERFGGHGESGLVSFLRFPQQ